MLDAMTETTESAKDNNESNKDQYEKDMMFSHSSNVKELDERTIIATAMVLMVAGYDTTGMTLAFASYELAKNQTIQKKLQDEIDDAFASLEDGQLPDYATIQ